MQGDVDVRPCARACRSPVARTAHRYIVLYVACNGLVLINVSSLFIYCDYLVNYIFNVFLIYLIYRLYTVSHLPT